jgi:hypothetical protein
MVSVVQMCNYYSKALVGGFQAGTIVDILAGSYHFSAIMGMLQTLLRRQMLLGVGANL